MLLKKCLGSRMSAFLHYTVWMVLVIRLLMPVTVTSPFHFFEVPAQSAALAVSEQTAAQTYQPAEMPSAFTADTDAAQVQASSTAENENGQNTAQSTPAAVKIQTSLTWQQIVVIVWLAGTGICLAYIAAVFLTLREGLKETALHRLQN